MEWFEYWICFLWKIYLESLKLITCRLSRIDSCQIDNKDNTTLEKLHDELKKLRVKRDDNLDNI